jgi:iron complex outermembrane receptor protein
MSRLTSLAFLAALAGGPTFANGASTPGTTGNDEGIAPQSLADALNAFARQSGLKLIYASDLATGRRSNGAPAGLPAAEKLERILNGTGLTARWLNDRTISIRAEGDDVPSLRGIADVSGVNAAGMRIASLDDQITMPQDARQSNSTDASPSSSQRKKVIEEIVVTGTHIHDADPIAPVITLTHDDLVTQGYTSLTQAIEQLPQNFKGGASQESNPVNGVGNGASNNYGYATGVNLRGLGAGATLVLLNGRRLAPTSMGGVTDISQIPLSAIDRVEILTDGASALYGSDAVAGVVNIITRKTFSGFELGARVNSITDGKAPNYGGNMLGGLDWDEGNLVLNVDHEQDKPLLARSRSFTSALADPTDLLPKQEVSSYFASLHNNFTDQLSLSSDVLISDRNFDEDSRFTDPLTYQSTGRARQYNASAELDYRFLSSWTATLVGQYSLEKDTYGLTYPSYDLKEDNQLNYNVFSLEPHVDGALFDWSGGTVRAALGAQFRRETFQTDTELGTLNGVPAPSPAFASNRNVGSIYGELLIPIIGSSNALPLVQRLRVDLSGRYDHYSDFGGTTNPKISADWVPIQSVSIHGTYAKSFQAPTLYALTPEINAGYVANLIDPTAATGKTLALLLDGNNPNLKPETAKSFTFGVTYEPDALKGLKLDVSYFSIDFNNQINRLRLQGYFFNALQQAAVLGPLVERDPSLSLVNQALSDPGRIIINETGGSFDPQNIGAIVNVGYVNSASVNVRGLDFTARYLGVDTRFGRFRADSDASYFTHYEQSITPDAQPSSLVNTVSNPLRFRAKLNIGWERSGWTANSRVNFSNAYTNTIDTNCSLTSTCTIGSWATVDLSLSYTTHDGNASDWLSGVRVSLDTMNVLNREPPRVTGLTPSLNYDAANANPLQRTFTITFIKRFGH